MRPVIALVLLASLSTLAIADDIDEPARERRLAVGTDPIGLLEGRYALSATYVTSRRIGLRGDIEIRDHEVGARAAGTGGLGPVVDLGGIGGWRAAVGMQIYLDRPLHGPYVEPGLAVAQRLVGYAYLGGLSDSMAPAAVPQYHQSLEPQIFVGWQWMFGSGLHMAAAIGVSRHSTGSGSSIAVPESYLRVGIAI